MRIVFMGTPEYAAISLRELLRSGHEVVLVLTQPDRERGRGKKVTFSPVKEAAIECGIPVFQPARIKDEDAVEYLKRFPADIFVVAAFGQILSKEILDIPPKGCVNVHASLLPKYRGAAPVQRAILDGEAITGVTIKKMNEGLDTGDIISQTQVSIAADDTGESLLKKLSVEGARLLVETLKDIEKGTARQTPQDDSASSYAGLLKKEMGCLDFSKSAGELDRVIRAYNPWPGAYTYLKGKMLKIWNAEPVDAHSVDIESDASAGTIIDVSTDSFDILTADGALRVFQLQIEGKRRMSTKEFLRGYRLEKNTVCGR